MSNKPNKEKNDKAIHGLLREFARHDKGDDEQFIKKVMCSISRSSSESEIDYISFIRKNWRFINDKRFLRLCATLLLIMLCLCGGDAIYIANMKASPLEIAVFASDVQSPDAPVRLRALLYDSKTKKPVAGATVRLKLTTESGKVTHLPFTLKTDKNGIAVFEHEILDLREGKQKVTVETGTGPGMAKAETNIEFVRSRKCMLTTDKPIYKPGETILIRTLSIDTGKRRPAAAEELKITIKDPKSNILLVKTVKTSEYGIAAAKFTLAKIVNSGYYTISAEIAGVESGKVVKVANYKLPKFSVNLKSTRNFFTENQNVTGTVMVNYVFGKPVKNAKCSVTAYALVKKEKPEQKSKPKNSGGFGEFGGMFLPRSERQKEYTYKFVEQSKLVGKTNAFGKFEYSFDSSKLLLEANWKDGDATIMIKTSVHAPDTSTLSKTKKFTISKSPIKIRLFPENGEIALGIPNKFFITTTYPDGKPAQAEVTLLSTRVKTSSFGVATVRTTPLPDGRLTLTAIDANNLKGKATFNISCFKQNTFLLRTDAPVYKTGETARIAVVSSESSGKIFIDLLKDGRCVVMKSISLRDNKGETFIDLTAELIGTIEIHAYKILPNTKIARQTRIIQVDSADKLEISAKFDKPVYEPGEQARVEFKVRNSVTGRPIPSALSLAVVDSAVFALSEHMPGMESVFFNQSASIAETTESRSAPRISVPWKTGTPTASGSGILQAQSLILAETTPDGYIVESHSASYEYREERMAKMRLKHLQNLFTFLIVILFALATIAIIPVIKTGVTRSNPKSYSSGFTTHSTTISQLKIIGYTFLLYTLLFFCVLLMMNIYSLVGTFSIKAVAGTLLGWTLLALIPFVTLIRNLKIMYKSESTAPTLKKELSVLPLEMLLLHSVTCVLLTAIITTPQKWMLWWCAACLLLPVITWGLLTVSPQLTPQRNMPMTIKERIAMIMRGFFSILPSPKVATALIPALIYLMLFFIVISMFLPFISIVKCLGGGGGGGYSGTSSHSSSPEAAGHPASSSSRCGRRSAVSRPPRVRGNFPETLFWKPELISDENGIASIKIPLADSITNWNMTASAISQNAEFGTIEKPIKVFKDFSIDLNFPTQLTNGDKISIPVTIYNYTQKTQQCEVRLKEQSWFQLIDTHVKKIEVPADELKTLFFTIKTLKSGNHKITAIATTNETEDAIERTIKIVPDGKKIMTSVSGSIDTTTTSVINFSNDSIKSTRKLRLKIYPGPLSQILDGLQSILRLPRGCFEQTTSATYPNILALLYMRKTKTILPNIEMEALSFIATGYQKLLNFEVASTGGFSLYGRAPANIRLSSYGLMEFNDMAKVRYVDPAIISRTRIYIINNLTTIENDQKALSYAIWALAESGDMKGLDHYFARISANALKSDSQYLIATTANALLACGRKTEARTLLEKLATKATINKEHAYWLAGTGDAGVFHEQGVCLDIETTALTTLALVNSRYNLPLAHKALNHLIASKNSHGGWGTTHSTVSVLRALITANETMKRKVGNMNLKVAVNDKYATTIKFTKENSGTYRTFDLSDHTKKGDNKISLTPSQNGSNTIYQLISEKYVPWSVVERAKSNKNKLNIILKYEKEQFKVDTPIACEATLTNNSKHIPRMLIAELPVPPGCHVEEKTFIKLRDDAVIDQFTITPTRITIYLDKIGQTPISIKYTIIAKYPFKAKIQPARLYKYYQPEISAESKLINLEVR